MLVNMAEQFPEPSGPIPEPGIDRLLDLLNSGIFLSEAHDHRLLTRGFAEEHLGADAPGLIFFDELVARRMNMHPDDPENEELEDTVYSTLDVAGAFDDDTSEA